MALGFLQRVVPPHVRPAVLVLVLVAVLFALSMYAQVPERTPQYGPRAAARMRVVLAAVQDAYAKARAAPDVHQQLMHVHWAMALLEGTRTLAADDRALGALSDVDVVRLDATLREAEAKCIATIEHQAAAAAAAQRKATRRQEA